jgi:hypothetical protein
MVTSVKKTNQKNHVSFMPHAFGQCEHFNQVELFEKQRFLVMLINVALSRIKFLNFGNS